MQNKLLLPLPDTPHINTGHSILASWPSCCKCTVYHYIPTSKKNALHDTAKQVLPLGHCMTSIGTAHCTTGILARTYVYGQLIAEQ
jgi:hypothetical protein